MSTTQEYEWIAVPSDGEEEIVAREDTREKLLHELGREECPTCGCISMDPDGYEIIRVQKVHNSLYL